MSGGFFLLTDVVRGWESCRTNLIRCDTMRFECSLKIAAEETGMCCAMNQKIGLLLKSVGVLCGLVFGGGQTSAQEGTRPASAVYPLDGVVSKDGAVWVVDRNRPGVWKFFEGALALEVEGSKRYREPMNAARCLAISSEGELAIGDPATREVYRKDAAGKWVPTVGGRIGIPNDLAFMKDGTLLIADLERRVLWKQKSAGEVPEVFAAVNPRGVFVDHADRIWVVSQDEQQLLKVSIDGSVEGVTSGRVFEFPHQVVVTAEDQIWVSDGYRKGLWSWKLGEEPKLVHSGEPLKNPVGLFLVENQVVVVDPHAQGVYRWTGNGFEKWFGIEAK